MAPARSGRLSWPPAVKKMIVTLVRDEGRPALTDVQLVHRLAESGVPVTVSTVRKYRALLGIAPARERGYADTKKSGPQAA